MNDIGRQRRRQRTLKKATVGIIPEDLIENALVVGGVERVVAMDDQNQAEPKKAIAPASINRNQGFLDPSIAITQLLRRKAKEDIKLKGKVISFASGKPQSIAP